MATAFRSRLTSRRRAGWINRFLTVAALCERYPPASYKRGLMRATKRIGSPPLSSLGCSTWPRRFCGVTTWKLKLSTRIALFRNTGFGRYGYEFRTRFQAGGEAYRLPRARVLRCLT